MIRALHPAPITVEVPDVSHEERAANIAVIEESQKNVSWWNARADELLAAHTGKFVCVAGQELFVGDDAREVLSRARAAHPAPGRGFFSLRVPTHQGPKIHALQRVLGSG